MEGGWLCIFGAFLEGCIVWRLVGLGAFFTFGMRFPNFVDTVLCFLLLLQSLDLLYRVVRSYELGNGTGMNDNVTIYHT